MITIRSAKSKLENEEGLNHLWIHLSPIGDVDNVRLQISVPPGIHRRRNLNHFQEDDTGAILIYQPNIPDDIFIEIYTQEAILYGEKTITFVLTYASNNGNLHQVEQLYPINIVNEEDMDNIIIDEEVVSKIKQLQREDDELSQEQTGYSTFKRVQLHPEQYSDLEKKYRIEG